MIMKFVSLKSILIAGIIGVVGLGFGLVNLSGAKFTSHADTGVGTISAGTLKDLNYVIKDKDNNTLTIPQVTALLSKVYPGWTDYIDVTVNTTADTDLNPDWMPLVGGTFIDAPSGFDSHITMHVTSPDITVSNASAETTLSVLSASKVTYNDATGVPKQYVPLGTGKLQAAGANSQTFRIQFGFKDADEGNTNFEDMLTYDPAEQDNQYMGQQAQFNLVLKAAIISNN